MIRLELGLKLLLQKLELGIKPFSYSMGWGLDLSLRKCIGLELVLKPNLYATGMNHDY